MILKAKKFLKSISKKIIVVIDEAYIEYACYRGHKSALDLIKDFKNIIITRSFSKIYAIAGSEWVMEYLKQILYRNLIL